MKLYEITDKYRLAIKEFYATEETSEDLAGMLDNLSGDLDEKLENSCCYYKNLLAEAKTFKEEAKRLADHAKALSSRADKFKGYVSHCLGNGGDAWSQGVHKISWRKSESVEIENESTIPNVYMIEKTTVSPDKTEIKNVIKSGGKVEGASLLQKNNVQIK